MNTLVEMLILGAARELLYNGGITPSGERRMDLYELAMKVVYAVPIRLIPGELKRVKVVSVPRYASSWWIGQENVQIELIRENVRIQSAPSAASYGVTIYVSSSDLDHWVFEE